MFATAGALASCRGRTRCYGIDPGRQLTDVTPDLTNMRLRMRTRHAVARRLPVVMVAGAGVVVLATVIGIRHAGPRHTPGDRLTSALGAPAPRAPLVRRPSHTVTVRLGHDGYTVTVPRAGAVTLAADGSHEPWSRFANGVARSTRFGREAITVQRSRTEEFLTVSKRQGARTWRWNLRALGLRPTPDRDGGGFVFRTQHAQSPLRLAPVRILDQQGRVVTPNGVHWLLRRAHDRSWRLELRLDDAKLPLPYVIDPAIDYPSPLYLSSSASSAAGSWRLLTTAPSGANTLTRTIPAANATGYYLFKPGAQNTATGTPSGTPTGTGFVQDIAGGTGFPAGTWSFSIKTQIPSTNLVAGTARLAVGMWTGTINNHGAFKAKQTIFAPTDDPAGQNIRSATSRTTTVAFSVPAFSLASTDRLYVEIWRKQVGGINSTSTSDREVDLVVNDGGSQIAHPPTDDTPPANAFSVANPTGGVYFTNPGGATGTLYYRGSAVGSFQLQDAATDSGSGVKQVGYPAVTAAGWIHSANTVTTGPTYPSSKYSWSAGSTSSPGAQAIAAQDNALNSSTGSPVTFTNDTTAPTVTMGALPTVIVSGQTLTASASDTGSGVASVAYYYCGPSPCTPNTLIGSSSTGPSYSFTWTTQPPDATYDLLARATDNTGSQADSAKQTVKIQNAAPDTTITIQPPDPSNNPAPTFWFSSTDPAATFQCKLDTAAFTVCTSPTTLNALADGTHSFSVRSISSAGKVDPTPATWSWTVDTAAPDTSITSEPNDPTSSAAASLSFTSTETGSSFQCQLDANTYAACTSPSTITGLLDGSHTFSVRATDAAGNTDANARHVHLDRGHWPAGHDDHVAADESLDSHVGELLVRVERGGLDVPVPARRRILCRLLVADEPERPRGRLAHVLGRGDRRRRQHRPDAGELHLDGGHDSAGHDDHRAAERSLDQPIGEILVHLDRSRVKLPVPDSTATATRRARRRRHSADSANATTRSPSRRPTRLATPTRPRRRTRGRQHDSRPRSTRCTTPSPARRGRVRLARERRPTSATDLRPLRDRRRPGTRRLRCRSPPPGRSDEADSPG